MRKLPSIVTVIFQTSEQIALFLLLYSDFYIFFTYVVTVLSCWNKINFLAMLALQCGIAHVLILNHQPNDDKHEKNASKYSDVTTHDRFRYFHDHLLRF